MTTDLLSIRGEVRTSCKQHISLETLSAILVDIIEINLS